MQNEVVTKGVQMQTGWYVALLILIMVLAGCLGGVVNFFQGKSDDPARADLRQSLVVGVAAALLVPLFLQMISSTILSTGAANPLELFIFAGFCLVAAISSKAFISSLSERVLKEAKEANTRSKEAQATAADAQGAALTAKGAANSAERKVEFALAGPENVGTAAAVEGVEGATPEDSMERLIEEYNQMRATQKAGPARSSQMTRVMRQMISVAPLLQEFDVLPHLQETANRGRRLAAYAWLYAMPEFQLLPELVGSVLKIKDEPFAQYWGILATGKVIGDRDKTQVPTQIVEQLQQLHASLSPGSDRMYELSRILKQLGVAVE